MNVVILGGGYAGLTAAVALRRQSAAANITLIDPRDAHLKITRLHHTLRQPLAKQRLAFENLAKRLGFAFVQGAPDYHPDALARYQRDRQITFDGLTHKFDYLLLTTGAPGIMPDQPGQHCYGIDQLSKMPGQSVLDDFAKRTQDAPVRAVTVVGAGASGVQFLFELVEALRQRCINAHVRLVDSDQRVLPQLPEAFDNYVRQRLIKAGVEFVPNSEFQRQEDNHVVIQSNAGDQFQLPSQLSLLFLGRKPQPERLQANGFGQIVVDGETLKNVFGAGDCTSYDGEGLDKLTAQAAIRKAKHAAENITKARQQKPLRPYQYQELGYVISLSGYDAVGWLGNQQMILKGAVAAGLKFAIENQYDLLLEGVDTYFDPSALQTAIGSHGLAAC